MRNYEMKRKAPQSKSFSWVASSYVIPTSCMTPKRQQANPTTSFCYHLLHHEGDEKVAVPVHQLGEHSLMATLLPCKILFVNMV
jgi:hypothetical protein